MSTPENANDARPVEGAPPQPSSKLVAFRKGAKKQLLQNFLPLGTLVAVVWALSWPQSGEWVSKWKVSSFRLVQTINVCTIFFISGITLKTADIMAALKGYRGFLYGLISIMVLTPCLAFGLIQIPFSTPEFAIGLSIFAVVPTTISSGVTLVTQAYGNTALALMLTVCSNAFGVATVPFALSLVVGTSDVESADGGSFHVDSKRLFTKLALQILLPLCVGKVIRESHAKVQAWVAAHKVSIGLISNLSLICIIWQTISRSQNEIMDQGATELLEALGAAIAMHLIFLTVNFGGVTALHLPERERKAVLLMASQKTLPGSVALIASLDEGELGDTGLILIPCVMGHLAQLFIDAYIVSRWIARYEAREQEQASEQPPAMSDKHDRSLEEGQRGADPSASPSSSSEPPASAQIQLATRSDQQTGNGLTDTMADGR